MKAGKDRTLEGREAEDIRKQGSQGMNLQDSAGQTRKDKERVIKNMIWYDKARYCKVWEDNIMFYVGSIGYLFMAQYQVWIRKT